MPDGTLHVIISLLFETVFINFCMKLDLWHMHSMCLLLNPGALTANYKDISTHSGEHLRFLKHYYNYRDNYDAKSVSDHKHICDSCTPTRSTYPEKHLLMCFLLSEKVNPSFASYFSVTQ